LLFKKLIKKQIEMEILLIALRVVTLLLFVYACFPAFSLIMRIVRRRTEPPQSIDETSFACIITAYRDLEIALPQVESILRQNYRNFRIYLVGDRCERPATMPVHELLSVLLPESPLNSKVLSIKYAMDRFVTEPSVILILDSDNLLQADTLSYLNDFIIHGYTAVQGQRTAKNLDNTVSALDAMGELYYNTIQRDTPFLLGSSATIAGSGMAILTGFFRSYIDRLFKEGKEFEIAEDKLLQLMLVQKGHRIAYCRNALIFDEKVTHGNQVQRQRTRWIRSWFQHWGSAMGLIFEGIIKFNWNILYFGLMLSFPPMFILLAGLLGCTLIAAFVDPQLAWLGVSGIAVFCLQFFSALLISHTPPEIWKAIPKIPRFIWRQVLAVMKIKASKNDFMVTSHSQYLGIEEVWDRRINDFPYLARIPKK
jgi:cellulose synthase/poly-beta-1,6-N-acetylglucosamine synthase-like glycosyltransferase